MVDLKSKAEDLKDKAKKKAKENIDIKKGIESMGATSIKALDTAAKKRKEEEKSFDRFFGEKSLRGSPSGTSLSQVLQQEYREQLVKERVKQVKELAKKRAKKVAEGELKGQIEKSGGRFGLSRTVDLSRKKMFTPMGKKSSGSKSKSKDKEKVKFF